MATCPPMTSCERCIPRSEWTRWRARFAKQIEAEKSGKSRKGGSPKDAEIEARADQAAAGLIPIIELCRYCPGMVTALGVSVGLTASAILSKGTIEQKER